MTVRDLAAYIVSLDAADHPDEGVRFGDPTAEVRGILVCWMPDPDATAAAAEAGANVIVGHEEPLFPYRVFQAAGAPDFLAWLPNRRRIDAWAGADVSVLRAHGTVDALTIFDDFAAQLDLGEPVVDMPGLVKLYEINPLTVRALVARVKTSVDLSALRVSADDLEEVVHRVGLLWGGTGLFVNVARQQQLLEQRPDVFIAGETDNYGFRFAREAGVPMIETSHEVSEQAGLRRFAGMLQERFPDIPVTFFENPIVWQSV